MTTEALAMEAGAFDRLAERLTMPVAGTVPSSFRLSPRLPSPDDGAKAITFRDYEVTLDHADLEPSPVLETMLAEIQQRYWNDVALAMARAPQPVAARICPECERSPWRGIKCTTCLSREI